MLRQPLKALVLALSSVALTACINSTKPVTDADIQAAQANQNLSQLYQQLSSQLREDPDDEVLQASLQKVGTQLAIKSLADFKNLLAAQLNADQILPPDNEPALTPLLSALERYDASYHQQALTILENAQAQREEYIDQQLQLISDLPSAEPEQRFALSATIAALDGNKEEHTARDQQLLWESLIQADHWLNQGDYPPAITLLENLMQIQPSEDLKGKLQQVRFDSAMETLRDLQFKRDYTGQRKHLLVLAEEYKAPEYLIQLEAPSRALWQYHQQQAGAALEQGNLLQSYSHLTAAQQLDGLYVPFTDTEEQAPSVTERLQQQLLQAANASAPQTPTQTYALLSVLKTLAPLSDESAILAKENQQQLQTLFTQHVTLEAFTVPEGTPELNALLQDQLVTVAQEHPQLQLTAEPQDKGLRIQGVIEQANVETQQHTETFEKAVVTDRMTQPNPEFTRWQQLSESEQKTTPRPLETQEEEVISSIPHHVTTEVKSAQLITTFRISDNKADQPLLADTLTSNHQSRAVSEAEVQMGLYFQPAKTESLPTDQTLYNLLIEQQAKQIINALISSLKPPAGRVLADARILRATDETDAAIQVLTEAFVMGQLDKASQPQARALLNSMVLQQHSTPANVAAAN